MLSRSIVSLWTAVLVWPTVGGLGGQAHGQDTRPAIAVFPFDNGGSYGQDKDNFDALQKGIAGLMISDLAAGAAGRGVERDELQKLPDEQKPGAAGRGGSPTAPQNGEKGGARTGRAGGLLDIFR